MACRSSHDWKRYIKISRSILASFLLAAELPTPKEFMDMVGYLSGDEKMSKSKGNILDPIEIIEQLWIRSITILFLKEVSFGNDGSIFKEQTYFMYK